MANKARHAFGMLENVDAAISSGAIDAYDILFVKDENGKPYVGWIDKDGKKAIVDDSTEFAELESQIAAKANANEVNAKIDEMAASTIANANAYTDAVLVSALGEYLAKKYVVSHKPEGTLVNYRDKEIRIMCPDDTEWVLQNSGENADANVYYIGFKAYAPELAASFREDLARVIADNEMYYFEGNDFAGVDESGRKYSIVWLPVAKYDGTVWTYYGANSSTDEYVGWYYSVEWYDIDGVMIASDCIRINLTNADCHSSIEPYYVSNMMTEIDAKIEEKFAEVSAYEILEF